MKNSNTLKISHRLANKEDLETLLLVEQEMSKAPLYHTLDRKEFKEYMKDSQVFLIYVDKKVAGYCSYKKLRNDLGEIDGMAILEKYRSQGLGTYCMQLLMEKLKGTKKVLLVTHPENNNSLRLYLKFGFVIKEWKDKFFGNEPRLVLYKTN